VARDIDRQLVSFYEQQSETVSYLRDNREFREAVYTGRYADATAFLSGMAGSYSSVDAVFAADPATGEILADGMAGQSAGMNVLEYGELDLAPLLRQAVESGFSRSGALASPLTGLPVVIVSVPVPRQNGTDAVLSVSFDLGGFSSRTLEHAVIGITGYPFVSDLAGLVIAHPNPDHVLKLDVSEFEFGREMISSPDGTLVEYLWEGKDKILSVCRNSEYGFITGTTMYVNDIVQAARSVSVNLALAGAAAVLLLAGLLIILFVTLVTRPLGQIASVTEAVAAGDLTVDFRVNKNDEIGRVQKSMKEMVAALHSIIADVSSGSRNVATGSQQMSSTAVQVSQGANTQAAGVEEVAASIEQITSNIQQNAENAGLTERIARQVAGSADESCRAVTGAMEAVSRISQEVTIIGEIARQTNMLALNAAIEAARAGDAGRGFAVVASEVRKLAEKSSLSAGSIMDLSRDTLAASRNASKMLSDLLPDIRKTAELVQEISASSREQHHGVAQINTAVQRQDHIIQQNAGVSEELSATAEELAGQATGLLESVRYFRVSGGAGRFP